MGIPGQQYDPRFVSDADRAALLDWLAGIRPIWEDRYGERHPPPDGETQRRLLRPVYWLGSWQFACLDYYRPPKHTRDRAVRAEPFPPVLQRMVARIEAIARRRYRGPDLPAGWRLNTLLVNFYGARRHGDRREDVARVGEHRDYEPGPVASVSIGERALFQFVTPRRGREPGRVVAQQWLDDGSLQIFGTDELKRRLLHRVQRVDRKAGLRLPPELPDFETRRVNLTFRWVPDEHVVRFADLGEDARHDVRRYLVELAARSPFFAAELAAAPDAP